MFRVVLKNVGSDMVNRDFTVDTTDINVAVVRASVVCDSILGGGEGIVFSVVGVEIYIMKDELCAGSVEITKLS